MSNPSKRERLLFERSCCVSLADRRAQGRLGQEAFLGAEDAVCGASSLIQLDLSKRYCCATDPECHIQARTKMDFPQ